MSESSNLSSLHAEVQVRTLLQHAWASVSHALQYKHEDDVPKALRRRLYRLAALLELADQEFETINREHRDLKASGDPEFMNILMVLRKALGNRRHSYQWIRDKTDLTLTDEEFDDLVENHPETFDRIRIAHRDESGNRVIPGRPGLKLKGTVVQDG